MILASSVAMATRRAVTFLAVIAFSIFPLLPNLLDRRLADTHEVYRYLVLGEWFHRAKVMGDTYPRWIAEMNGGFGYPEFVFYQPGYFFLQDFTAGWLDEFLHRQLVTLVLIAIIGGAGFYLLARRYVGAMGALGALAIFVLAPYSRINLFVRGDLSEWLLLEWMPWCLWFLFIYVDRRMGCGKGLFLSWLALSVAVCLATYTHPVAVLFLPLLLLGLVVVAISGVSGLVVPNISLKIGFEVFLAIVVGLSLSSPYWLVVVMMKPAVASVDVFKDWGETWQNTTTLANLLWGSWLGMPKSFHETEFLGAPFVLLALLGWWWGRKKPLVLSSGWMYLALIILMAPMGRIFWQMPPFSLILFPWRLAVFAPSLQAISCLGLLTGDGERSKWGRSIFWLGVTCLFFYAVFSPYQYKPWLGLGRLGQKGLDCLFDFSRTARPQSYPATMDLGEWQPRTSHKGLLVASRLSEAVVGCGDLRGELADLLKRHFTFDSLPSPYPRPLIEIQSEDWLVEQLPMSKSRWLADYQLTGTAPSRIIINQFYLPGWQIFLNGMNVSEAQLMNSIGNDGLIQVQLEAGRWHLQARYELPEELRVMVWTTMIFGGIGGCVLFGLITFRRSRPCLDRLNSTGNSFK